MKQYKQVIILRNDLGMSKGKMIAQGAHASLKAYEKSSEKDIKNWKQKGSKKIVLQASEDEINQVMKDAETQNLIFTQIKDAGHTEVKPGTKTAIAIGPAKEKDIDKVTGQLKLIK